MLEFWFSPHGRAARADYWYWLMLPAAVGLAVLALIVPLFSGPDTAALLLFVGFAVFCLSHTAMTIRRLHDQSLSGWYSLALLAPIAGGLAWLGAPDSLRAEALSLAMGEGRLLFLVGFAIVFAPFAYVLALVWFGMGKDGVNRYGRDPLYR